MKKLLIFVVILVVSIYVVELWASATKQPISGSVPTPSARPTAAEGAIDYPEIEYGGVKYSFLMTSDISANKLKLINNTSEWKTSGQLMKENNCVAGINGGYYGTDSKPVGWMVVSGKEVSRASQSSLANQFIVITNNELKIQDIKPENGEFGLQAGPGLVIGGRPQVLSLVRDKPARRMVMGTLENGVFLLAIFNAEADTTGPNLIDLPKIVMQIEEKTSLDIVSAVNLDGGGASAFYSPHSAKWVLEELDPVGSWWCVIE